MVNVYEENFDSGVSPEQLKAGDPSGLDELGFSKQLPHPYQAPAVQFLSEKKVAQRNASLMKGAFGRLGAGLDQLSSYRPGGAAAMTSGLFQGQANVLANSRTQAPDLMFWHRANAAHRARKASKRAGYMNLLGGAIQAAGTIAGGIAGGAAAGAAAGSAGQAAVPGGGGGPTGNVDTGFQPMETAQAQIAPPSGGPEAGGGGAATQGPAGGPQTAQAQMGADPGMEAAMSLQSGSVGSGAVVQQLTATMGPENAASLVGMIKADDTSYENLQFYDGFEAGLDQMMVRVFSGAG